MFDFYLFFFIWKRSRCAFLTVAVSKNVSNLFTLMFLFGLWIVCPDRDLSVTHSDCQLLSHLQKYPSPSFVTKFIFNQWFNLFKKKESDISSVVCNLVYKQIWPSKYVFAKLKSKSGLLSMNCGEGEKNICLSLCWCFCETGVIGENEGCWYIVKCFFLIERAFFSFNGPFNETGLLKINCKIKF